MTPLEATCILDNISEFEGVKSVSFGCGPLDAALSGGLSRGAVHEIFAAAQSDIAAATGVALALTLRAAGQRPILIVRQDVLEGESGHLDGSGLIEWGLDPARVVLVKARDAGGVLRAGEQGVRCPALGAVLMQSWGNPKVLDLKASRRLALAAAKSGVTAFMLRAAASPQPSAAATRWSIEAEPSRPRAAQAPGAPAFTVSLLRHRGGIEGRSWRVEWNRDRSCFEDAMRSAAAPLPRSVVSVSRHRPSAPQWNEPARRAG